MMGTTKESELHILGKAVFEDAEGKDIQLPAPPSPRFNPPLRHTVKKVEWERGTLKKCVNSQAVYPLSEQDGLEAQERRYTAHEEGKH